MVYGAKYLIVGCVLNWFGIQRNGGVCSVYISSVCDKLIFAGMSVNRMNSSELIRLLVSRCGPEDEMELW